MEILSNKKIVFFALAAAILPIAAALTLPVIQQYFQPKIVVGAFEKVALNTPKGIVEVDAKIDTGADYSSVDETFIKAQGMDITGLRKVNIVSARGRETRDVIELTFNLAGKTIFSVVTIADRSELSTSLLIGKNDLSNFAVDPSAKFLTIPGEVKPFSSLFFDAGRLFTNIPVSEKEILIIPILGAIIVFAHMVLGLKTYGIFGPVVIAITFLNYSIFSGLALYAAMIAAGMSAKHFILKKLALPHIAELSLVIFVLVVLLFAADAILQGRFFNLADVFFPLIITSHLIDRATQTVEEYRLADALPALISTFVLATIAALAGRLIIGLPSLALWLMFFVSISAVIISGNYIGLRLSEVFRFKFLRKH